MVELLPVVMLALSAATVEVATAVPTVFLRLVVLETAAIVVVITLAEVEFGAIAASAAPPLAAAKGSASVRVLRLKSGIMTKIAIAASITRPPMRPPHSRSGFLGRFGGLPGDVGW